MQASNTIVKVEYVFRSPAETVFDAWLDPELLPQWMFHPKMYGQSVIAIDMAAQQGGAFAFRIRRGNKQIEYRGEYVRIERPRRLVFTWITVGRGDETLVTIEIEPLESGCRLILHHDLGAVSDDHAAMAKADWEAELNFLNETINA